MSLRSFSILAVVAALCLALGGWAVIGRAAPRGSIEAQSPLFPGLIDKLNETVTVVAQGPGGVPPLTMKRDAAGAWSLEERGGYPVDYAKVRGLAVGAAQLQVLEPKTAAADRLARLELEDPKAPGAKSKLLRLLDKDGRPLAELVAGKTKYGVLGGGRSGIYVRKAGEEQAYLALGELDVPATATDVLQRRFLDIAADRIASVTLRAGTPEAATLTRGSAPDGTFALGGPLPEGKELDPEKAQRLAGSFASLELQDVMKASELPLPPQAPVMEVRTTDGLKLEVRAVRQGEGEDAAWWAVFTPSAATPDGAPAQAAPPNPPAVEGTAPSGAPAVEANAPGGAPAGEGAAGGQPPAAPAAPDAARQVADLSKALNGWAFKLSEYLAQRYAWGQADLLADRKPPQG